MQNPCIVRITLRRHAIVCPARIIFKVGIVSAFQIERRICHNIVEIEFLMLVIGKRGIVGCAEIVADTTQRKIHLSQTICGRFFLLTININSTIAILKNLVNNHQ